ncbi:MAG: hypothetical protein HYZ09_00980 [Candidatus Kerfeldbacteria bacterium]|nr:hypothetical protein [Candidatus Kerfeldbacteria bacterium]
MKMILRLQRVFTALVAVGFVLPGAVLANSAATGVDVYVSSHATSEDGTARAEVRMEQQVNGETREYSYTVDDPTGDVAVELQQRLEQGGSDAPPAESIELEVNGEAVALPHVTTDNSQQPTVTGDAADAVETTDAPTSDSPTPEHRSWWDRFLEWLRALFSLSQADN